MAMPPAVMGITYTLAVLQHAGDHEPAGETSPEWGRADMLVEPLLAERGEVREL